MSHLISLAVVPLLACSVLAASDCASTHDSGFSCSEGSSKFSFFYQPKTKLCQPFLYKGCGGNGNRFDSRADCLTACSGAENRSSSMLGSLPTSPGSQWLQAEKCGSNHLIPNHHFVECQRAARLCPSEHSCKDGVCCPSKEYICSLIDDTGSFAEGIDDKPRFAWSDKVKSCVRFSYYGANGNYNNFPNFYSCIRFCSP